MKVYKAKDLMTILKIGRDTAYALMRSSTFPSYKLNERYYVTEEALNRWLSSLGGKEIEI